MRPAIQSLITCLLFFCCSAIAQQDKRPLTHDDYDLWNSIGSPTLSSDGNWLMYVLRDGKEATELKIRNTQSAKEYSIKDAMAGRFSFNSRSAVYRIVPNKETIRKLKQKETPEEDLPKEKFQILDLASSETVTIEQNKSYAMPEKNGDWIAVLLKRPKSDETVSKSDSQPGETFEVTPQGLKRFKEGQGSKKESKSPESKTEESTDPKKQEQKNSDPAKDKAKSKKEKKEKDEGSILILRNLSTGAERRFPNVVDFQFDERGKTLVFTTSSEQSEEDGVSVLDLKSGDLKQVISGLGNYKNLAMNADGNRLAFVSDRDDYESKDPFWSLYHWRTGQSQASLVATENTAGIPDEWWVSSTATPRFSENNRYLFFYTAPKPEDANEEEDENKDPTAKLDLWHWQDPLLQPQQLLEAKEERNRSYLASYDLRTRKINQLANIELPDVFLDPERKSDITLGVSNKKYLKTISWDMPGFRDAYLINVRTGKTDLILEKIRSTPSLSPDGRYVVWWDTESQNWFTASTKEPTQQNNVSDSIEFPLFNELHDTPSDPSAYGIAGWTTGDKRVLVYDRYDIWSLDPSGNSDAVCLTDGAGRRQQIRYRLRVLDDEARNIDSTEPMVLSAFDETSKESGFCSLALGSSPKVDSEKSEPALKTLIMLPEQLSGLRKASDDDRLIFTRSSFERFPDIWTTDSSFGKITRLSKANPQQFEYAWGSVELTNWQATDGQDIEGLIYKPEDFDETKKYPMIVYFYERYSDRMHRHYAPAAGRSIINFTFYTSRGYVVFVPDIPYKTGEPGPSAANSVLPGIEHLIDQGYVDEKRIGTQGHSWGGYQTAYLVTQTDIFACAESGAPVSNMTSAYGGIRWQSGLSRMFQYERTQSRIGDTLWNARDKYIANSPLFFADKVNTPLLILHNDEDGAVPWYQGIEMFVALRRLEKPAWLLNYNGNPHWVMGRENRLDFAKRMQQFFDHYLKGEPMPTWMSKGIPAIKKGQDFGFEPEEQQENPKDGN